MTTQSQVPVALLGAATCADSYAETIFRRAQLRTSLDEPGVVAAVVAPSAHDPFSHAREALLAGIPVLTPLPFTSVRGMRAFWIELSIRKGRVLRFVEPVPVQGEAIPSCRGS